MASQNCQAVFQNLLLHKRRKLCFKLLLLNGSISQTLEKPCVHVFHNVVASVCLVIHALLYIILQSFCLQD